MNNRRLNVQVCACYHKTIATGVRGENREDGTERTVPGVPKQFQLCADLNYICPIRGFSVSGQNDNDFHPLWGPFRPGGISVGKNNA